MAQPYSKDFRQAVIQAIALDELQKVGYGYTFQLVLN